MPFFYRNRLFPEALSILHGPKIYIPGSGGYDIGKWVDKTLNIASEEIEEGANVVHLAVAVARALGCNPLILMGVDLAYTKGKMYSEGMFHHPLFDVKSIYRVKEVSDNVVTTKDMYGHPIDTLDKWIKESRWYGYFAQKYPEADVYNATLGGLGMEGIKNISLEEVEEILHVKKSLAPMEDIVHQELFSRGPHSIDKESIKNLLEQSINNAPILKTFESFYQDFYMPQFKDVPSLELLFPQAHQYRETMLLNMHAYLSSIRKNVEEILSKALLKISENSEKKEVTAKKLVLREGSSLIYLYRSGARYAHMDLQEGLREYYYPSGQLKSKWKCIDNQIEGAVLLYYPHGQLEREIQYTKGLRHGVERRFYKEGVLEYEVHFHQGVACGEAQYFTKKGSLLLKITYDERGQQVDKEMYDEKGEKISLKEEQKEYIERLKEQAHQFTHALKNVADKVLHDPQLSLKEEQKNALVEEIEKLKEWERQLQEEIEKDRHLPESIMKTSEIERKIGDHVQKQVELLNKQLETLDISIKKRF
jgi:antitoxin component YwqK of YwqJK toxin-antitoxin module